MTSSNKIFIRKTAALLIFLSAYFLAILFHSKLWSDILSPINAFVSGGFLYFAYLKSDRKIRISIMLLMYSFACFTWGLADVIWAIMDFYGLSPENSLVISIIYALPNILFFASLLVFLVEQFKKWDLVQFGIDLIVNAFMIIVLFWILFLHKDISILNALLSDDITSILSILIDILICISLGSWFMSIRSGKVLSFMRIIAFGLFMYAFVDMLYYYIDYNELYMPNSIVDFAYIVSLCIIAFGTLWKTYKNKSIYDLTSVTNIGGRMRWAYLFIYPFLAIAFSTTGLINTRLSVMDMISFAVPIILYWGSCKYVQISIEKEALLKRQNEVLEQRVAKQVSELTFLANQDTLTTLFNRRYFIFCLDDTIQSMSQDNLLAILMIDLDRFKTINDTYGHNVGDQMLIELSRRMIEWNRYGATVARLGGDEFAVMFSGKYTQSDIEDFCVQIIDICSKPIDIGNTSLNPTMSVGIALVSENARNRETLMKHADIAMYSAKSQGYNKYQFYNAIIDQDFKQNVEIEALLKQTDVEKDFKLFYQPQYSVPDLKLIGAEALIRWENREHGFIPPNVFIPIAEEIDYIFKIGKWVMRETIRQSKTWNSKYPTELKVGFNVSPKQFNDNEFIRLLEILLADNNIDPKWIDAEITENVMIQDRDQVEAVFKMLRKLGVSVSIDDFGSGYSALSSLNKYPFDRIKLDKSLINNVTLHNASGTNVVKAAINMAHASGIQTIAEGVESNEQLGILTKLGCDQVQGYLLGRPVPADIFEQLYIMKHCEDIMV